MNRSRVISLVLGVVLLACVGVIAADQAGAFGNDPFPGLAPAQPSSPYDLPPDTTTPATPDSNGSGTEIPPSTDPTPTNPDSTSPPQSTDNSGYGELK